ncbi:MAG: heavy-metal-associated domain-containing protein [Campylobacterota bacterium]|nr:heavy-metal-associated domain-containing protein [Campylobacterota bacterium]
MKQIFEVQNVKCGGCANTLKKALKEEYGDVEVDLEKTPREITIYSNNIDLEVLKLKLRTLGYPLVDDELSTFQTINTKAKSFVSCAIGKME